MHLVKQIVLASVLVLVGYGASYAQTTPQPKPIVQKVKIKKVQPPKPIKNKDIKDAQKKLVLSTSEKAIQKASRKRIQDERNALRKSNQKTAADFKKMQKVYAKKLLDEE